MKKFMRNIIVTVLLLACSGCCPVFVPVEGGDRGGDRGGERGGHDHHDQGDRGSHRD